MLNHAMRYVIIIIGCLLAAAAYNLFLGYVTTNS